MHERKKMFHLLNHCDKKQYIAPTDVFVENILSVSEKVLFLQNFFDG